MIRFPDAGAARAFLNDPDYQPVKELRYSITSRGQTVVMPRVHAEQVTARFDAVRHSKTEVPQRSGMSHDGFRLGG